MEEAGRLLVVDDDMINRTLLVSNLKRQGYLVETARDGREALRRLETEPVDVVLLDLWMPEMDGFQVLETLKKDKARHHIPVIVISGLGEMESVVRCIEMGAADFLPKPFDPVLLRARVASSLAGKRLFDLERRHLQETLELNRQLAVRNRFIQQTFGRYLSDEIVFALLESPEGLLLGGENRKVTILMADLRGFTAQTERLAPERVVKVLNNYLGCMADLILEHQGTIDEFVGDAVLGLFGAPIGRADDARRGVACALAMQAAMEDVNRTNREEGLPEVAMGIALHTGDVVVGNVGSLKRTKYGVVGSHVNLTSRIESCTVGGQILISNETRREAGPDLMVGDPMMIRAKGVREPVQIYDLRGIGGSYGRYLARRESQKVCLERPLNILLTLVEGKVESGEACAGEVVQLSRDEALIRTALPLALLANLRVQLVDVEGDEGKADIYGKVLAKDPVHHDRWLVRYTSVTPEIALVLSGIVDREGRAKPATTQAAGEAAVARDETLASESGGWPEGSVGALFDLAVAAELRGMDFYRILGEGFTHLPNVASFFRGMSDDEQGHARELGQIRDSLAREALMAPAARETLQGITWAPRILSAARIAGLETLDDAYELAQEFEGSEINRVFSLLTSRFVSGRDRVKFYSSAIQLHQSKLTRFSTDHGGREWRRGARFVSDGST